MNYEKIVPGAISHAIAYGGTKKPQPPLVSPDELKDSTSLGDLGIKYEEQVDDVRYAIFRAVVEELGSDFSDFYFSEEEVNNRSSGLNITISQLVEETKAAVKKFGQKITLPGNPMTPSETKQ